MNERQEFVAELVERWGRVDPYWLDYSGGGGVAVVKLRGTNGVADMLYDVIQTAESYAVDGGWYVGGVDVISGETRGLFFIDFDEQYDLPPVPHRCQCGQYLNSKDEWDRDRCDGCTYDEDDPRIGGER